MNGPTPKRKTGKKIDTEGKGEGEKRNREGRVKEKEKQRSLSEVVPRSRSLAKALEYHRQ